jgi:hypothetical protein
VTGACALHEQLGGALVVARIELAFEINQGEVVGSDCVAELGRLIEQRRAGLLVARPAAALKTEYGEREHGLRIVERGGALVEFGCLGVIAADAEPIGVKLGQERQRLRIVLGRKLGGFLEGGEEIAALIGAKRAVIACCRLGRRGADGPRCLGVRVEGEQQGAERDDYPFHDAVSGNRRWRAAAASNSAARSGSRQM